LPVKFGLCYLAAMSATQVIEEIKHLPPAEQSRVLRFAFELARERQLSGETLSELAQRMADSNDSAEKKRLREEIHRGFYGEYLAGRCN
jgi:TilS substrate binding domain